MSVQRRMAAANPGAFLPGLADSVHGLYATLARLAGALNDLGLNLSKLGRRDEALAAMRESVQIRRALGATRPEAFRIDLARSLANLADLVEQMDGGDAARRLREEVAMLKAASTAPDA